MMSAQLPTEAQISHYEPMVSLANEGHAAEDDQGKQPQTHEPHTGTRINRGFDEWAEPPLHYPPSTPPALQNPAPKHPSVMPNPPSPTPAAPQTSPTHKPSATQKTGSKFSGDQHPDEDKITRTNINTGAAERLPRKAEIVSMEELELDDVVIAVMGPTGSGKSTFIRSASGFKTYPVGHGLKSDTSEVVAIRFWDEKSRRCVVLVDTPGFDNAFKSDTDVLRMISESLNSSYKKNILLSGILYFHRITDNSMGNTPLKNLRMFRDLCGKDALEKVYFTTTMWDEVAEHAGETRLDQLRRDYWTAMIDLGAQIARCRSDNDSAKEVIRRILLQKGAGKTLLIQQEMVEQKKGLGETSGSKPQPYEESTAFPKASLQVAEAEERPVIALMEDLEPNDIVIAVFGPTGSGKSTFVRSASGRATHVVGHTLKSCTSEISAVKFWDSESCRHVVIVDTPGFDHTFKSELDILAMTSKWLNSSYDKNKLLSGILYLHRITDNRMSRTPLRNLRIFRELCGKDALDKVFFTTTMWDEVTPDVGERRLEELKTEYWNTMLKQGAQTYECRSSNDLKRLIQDIVFTDDQHRVLQIQQEMDKEKKKLKETAAGKQLFSQLEELVERQSELLQTIAKERKAVASDPKALAELQEEYLQLREQVDDKLRQMQELKLPWLKSMMRRRMKFLRRGHGD